MENEQQPIQPVVPVQQPVPPTPATPPAVPQQEGTQMPVASPGQPETPKPAKKGIPKWVWIAVGIFVVAATAAGLYFGGVFKPADQLKGAAEEQTPTQEEPRQAETTAPENKQDTQALLPTEELTNITQVAPNACPKGQVMDPLSNRCSCDINNNYFAMNISGAYTSPTAGQEPTACTTCMELSDQIRSLGQSEDPADIQLRAQLDTLAEENNCSPCAIFDDRIHQAYEKKMWDKYFELVVEKSNDKTCGRSLAACDSMKWQLLFLNDLRDTAGKDPKTNPPTLESLKKEQQSLSEDLGGNAACYTMETLCGELKSVYGTGETTIITGTTSGISSSPLLGNVTAGDYSAPSSQETAATGSSQQEASMPDFASIKAGQLFDRDFYLLHCPVDGQQSTGKVSRTKKQPASTEQQPASAPQSATAPAPNVSTSSTKTPVPQAPSLSPEKQAPMPVSPQPPASATSLPNLFENTSNAETTTTTITTPKLSVPKNQFPKIVAPDGSSPPGMP